VVTYDEFQKVISRVEKEQAGHAKLSNARFKNSTLQQPTKTATVDMADTTEEYNEEVAAFNGKGKWERQTGAGPQAPAIHVRQPGEEEQEEDQLLQATANSLLGAPPDRHWSWNCPVKAKMMAQFMQQNGVSPYIRS
jgi:hypothetical protein